MNLQRSERIAGIRRFILILCMALAVLLWTDSARAGLLVSVESVSAAAGSTGNTLEVDVTNTGTSPVTIGGFNFEISTGTTNIDFTQATINTTNFAYIFAGNSALSTPPDGTINTTSGQSLKASDVSTLTLNSPPGGPSLDAGETLGLGLVFFDVAAGTSVGKIPVTLASWPDTSFSSPVGNDISGPNGDNLTFSNGTITVTPSGSPVPEPSTLLLLSTGLAFLGIGYRRKK